MKKLFVSLLTVLTPVVGQALALANVADPQLYSSQGISKCELCYPFNLRLGYYGDFVFQRNLFESVDGVSVGNVSNFRMFTNAAEFVLNYYNCFEFFGTVGQTDTASTHHRSNTSIITDVMFPATSWSTGARWSFDWCGFTWGLEGQYFHFNTNLDYGVLYSTGAVSYYNRAFQFTYSEWQGGFGAARKIQSYEYFDLIPYIGVTASGLRATKDILSYQRQFRAAKVAGLAVGMTALLNDSIGLTAEGRFANETALYINGQFRF